MTIVAAYELIARLMAFALFWQSIEFIKLKNEITEKGIWRWSDLRTELLFLPALLVKFFDYIMPEKNFTRMMKVRLMATLVLIIYPQSSSIIALLFVTTFLITIRWRGSFNGGSDYMSLIALLTLLVGSMNVRWMEGALWYLTIQVILSYFIAGVHKAKRAKWQTGEAAADFISAPHYQAPRFVLKALEHPFISKMFSWSVLLFELAYPLVLLFPKTFFIFGVLFHLSNFAIFGLNRFFWVWPATYPALYLCASLLK